MPNTLVTIRLSAEFGPPLWFLGEPRQLKLMLTTADPGPVELDFKDLNEQEQKYILNSVSNGDLDCSHDPDELLQLHLSMFSPKVEAPIEDFWPPIDEEGDDHLPKQDNVVPIKKDVPLPKADKPKVPKAIKSILKKPVSSIKELLKDSKDIKFLRTLLKEELSSKNVRPGVVSYLELAVKKLEKEVILSIEESLNEPPIKIPTSYMKKELYDDKIEESEEELVEFVRGSKS